MAQDAAAVRLPAAVASCQAAVPAGGDGVGATGKAPQRDVHRGPQDAQRHAI